MTSRERVRRAVRFEGPDRVPFMLPDAYGSDFVSAKATPDPNHQPTVLGENEWKDEWGCVWVRLTGDKTKGQVKVHPLTDYALLDDFEFPDYKNPARYEKARTVVTENRDDKFVLGKPPLSFIHVLEYLRGHEAAWTDPYDHPDELGRLLDRLADIAIDGIDRLAELGADGIISCDDWGLQDRPMVSPKIFREFWKPRYKRVYHHAHEKGMLTFLHSCGYIIDLLDDFIDAELDVIQMDQQENMGLENLSRRFGGRLCFWSPVDIQNTMITGSVDDVRAYARKLIDGFGRFNGGFIATWYTDPDAVKHSWEKINAMAETFVEYGKTVQPFRAGS